MGELQMSNLTPPRIQDCFTLGVGFIVGGNIQMCTSIAQRVPSSSKINFVDLRSELIPDIEPHQIADGALLLVVVCLSQNH